MEDFDDASFIFEGSGWEVKVNNMLKDIMDSHEADVAKLGINPDKMTTQCTRKGTLHIIDCICKIK